MAACRITGGRMQNSCLCIGELEDPVKRWRPPEPGARLCWKAAGSVLEGWRVCTGSLQELETHIQRAWHRLDLPEKNKGETLLCPCPNCKPAGCCHPHLECIFSPHFAICMSVFHRHTQSFTNLMGWSHSSQVDVSQPSHSPLMSLG